jgi:hypothetical protein
MDLILDGNRSSAKRDDALIIPFESGWNRSAKYKSSSLADA